MSLVDTPFWRAWLLVLLVLVWLWVVGTAVLVVAGGV